MKKILSLGFMAAAIFAACNNLPKDPVHGDPDIKLSMAETTVSRAAQTVTVDVNLTYPENKSNSETVLIYNVSPIREYDWCSEAVSDDFETLTFTLTANDTDEVRFAVWDIYNRNSRVSFTIYQNPEVTLTNQNVEGDGAFMSGGQLSIFIESNVDVDYSLSKGCNWMKVNEIAHDHISFDVDMNAGSRRSCEVQIIADNENSLTIPIIQNGASDFATICYYDSVWGDGPHNIEMSGFPSVKQKESNYGYVFIDFDEELKSIGDDAFSGCGWLGGIDIPGKVETIGARAFKRGALMSITIPQSVSRIGGEAFAGNESIVSIYCKPVTPPTIGADIFKDDNNLKKIYVPTASVDAYKAAWSSCANLIEGYSF